MRAGEVYSHVLDLDQGMGGLRKGLKPGGMQRIMTKLIRILV